MAAVNPNWFYLPGFTFLVLAHPGSPGQNPESRKMVVVVVVVVVRCFKDQLATYRIIVQIKPLYMCTVALCDADLNVVLLIIKVNGIT